MQQVRLRHLDGLVPVVVACGGEHRWAREVIGYCRKGVRGEVGCSAEGVGDGVLDVEPVDESVRGGEGEVVFCKVAEDGEGEVGAG
jgi:hypothetical protein